MGHSAKFIQNYVPLLGVFPIVEKETIVIEEKGRVIVSNPCTNNILTGE